MRLFPFLLAAGIAALAQEPTQVPASPPPVTVRRQPPPGLPDPKQYPFEQILNKLQEDAPVKAAPAPAAAPAKVESVVASKPPKDIPISQSAEGALALGKSWMTEKHEPAPGKDGRVLYSFGARPPRLLRSTGEQAGGLPRPSCLRVSRQ